MDGNAIAPELTRRLECGDCLDVLAREPADAYECCVTDSPYGLSFMGREWDHGVPGVPFWQAAYCVLKPGAHLLAFGGTRTFHRLTCAIEDAGFEIRDCIMWVYGSGFPKSIDVGKAIDAAAGASREVVGTSPHSANRTKRDGSAMNCSADGSLTVEGERYVTAPATDLAKQWDGWGTALKPAWEPIIVARKPLDGTVAANVAKWGTGAINVDASRVPGTVQAAAGVLGGYAGANRGHYEPGTGRQYADTGRFPANLIHDGSDEVEAEFAKAGDRRPGERPANRNADAGGRNAFGAFEGTKGERVKLDSGSASRFFFNTKDAYNRAWQDLSLPPESANIAEPNSSPQRLLVGSALADALNSVLPAGLHCGRAWAEPFTVATPDELRRIRTAVTQLIPNIAERFWLAPPPAKLTLSLDRVNVAATREPTGITTITASHWKSDGSADVVTFAVTPTNSEPGAKDCGPSRFIYCAKASKADRGEGNDHPTVKPNPLMRYLVKLVTPPGGVVLDPFAGSGSTLKAAREEGFGFLGIEKDPHSFEIAKGRAF